MIDPALTLAFYVFVGLFVFGLALALEDPDEFPPYDGPLTLDDDWTYDPD